MSFPLNADTLTEIFLYLSEFQRLSLAQTCRLFHESVMVSPVWHTDNRPFRIVIRRKFSVKKILMKFRPVALEFKFRLSYLNAAEVVGEVEKEVGKLIWRKEREEQVDEKESVEF